MHPSKQIRLNAAQFHIAGATYLTDEHPVATGSDGYKVEGHSPRGPPQTLTLCTLPEIMLRIKVSKSAVYVWMAQGKFPKPYFVSGPRFSRWSVQEIDSWLEDPAAWIAANAGKSEKGIVV
jgi:prophage regulatory protein